MALLPMYHNYTSHGMFDGLDSEVTSFKGGEVCGFASVSTSVGVDKHSKDVDDGYTSNTRLTRTVVTKTLTSGMRPLFLADEGVKYYGTMFGTLIGGTVGQDITGTQLGPSTAYGSGKITLWEEGIYRVSLDAVDTTASTGLIPSNTSVNINSALYATAAGLLTPTVGSAFESIVVGRFMDFCTSGALVSTPASLVTTNAPFTWCQFRFQVET